MTSGKFPILVSAKRSVHRIAEALHCPTPQFPRARVARCCGHATATMGAQEDAMLTLMRAPCVPNTEILLAKGLDDLQQVALKYGVALPGTVMPAPATEAASDDESEDSSSSSSAAFNDMRRWTKPPSYYEARSPTVSSQRGRRWQVSRDSSDTDSPVPGSASSSSSGSFGSRFGPSPDGDAISGGGSFGGRSASSMPPTAW